MHDKHLRAHLRDGDHLRDFALEEFISAIRTGRLIAFTGSYSTEDMGYRTWSAFLQGYFDFFVEPPAKISGWIREARRKLRGTEAPVTTLIDLIVEHRFSNFGDGKAKLDGARAKLIELDYFGLDKVQDPKFIENSTPYHIVESLGVNRIITTNYDLETEWQLMVTSEEKANNKPPERAVFFGTLLEPKLPERKGSDRRDVGEWPIVRDPRSNMLARRLPSGRTARSDVFNRDRADRLFEFAIGAPDHDGHVLHLHGRATGDDQDELIVGLGDYERQYRRSDITKLPFEHALKLLYSGNPVIFVGSGMNEAEVTNALQDFVSDDPQRRLAPAFVIWSATPNATKAGAIKLRPVDQLRRIEWYRRFGVLTIYDCELKWPGSTSQFDPARALAELGAQGKPRRVSYAVRTLGAYAREHIAAFNWQRSQLRSAQARFPCPPELVKKEGMRFDVWRANELAEECEELMDLFPLRYNQSFDPDKPLQNRVDGEHLRTLFCGAPVKAIIDRPGFGHGYLAKVIARTFAYQLSNEQQGVGVPTAASVINAGFLCDMDSTFSLISGLFDDTTAFGKDGDQPPLCRPPNAKSRQEAFHHYVETLQEEMLRPEGLSRHLLLVINGMDRFFETSGYTLSTELDDMMRMIAKAYRTAFPIPARLGGGKATIHDWVEERQVVNPFTVILLGTARVERYLADLCWEREKDTSARHGDYAILSASDYRPGRDLLNEIKRRNKAERTRLGTSPDFDHPFARPHSNYLKLVEHHMKLGGLPKEDLSIARRARIDRGGARSIGDLRRSTLAAYVRSSSLQKAMPDDDARLRLPDLCLDILSSLAFFGEPIDRCVLAAVPRIRKRLGALRPAAMRDKSPRAVKRDEANLGEALALLVRLKLVLEFDRFPESPADWVRYGIHRTVMAEMRDRYGVPISDAKLSTGFNLSLFASQLIDDYTPEPNMHLELGELVEAAVNRCRELVNQHRAAEAEPAAHLRAALAVMRNYFTTSALLMIEPPPGTERYSAPLTDQAERIERLIKAAEALAVARRAAKAAGAELKGPEAFYPDDLVWLHNELGVVKLVQGDLYKARFALDAAETINRMHVEFGDELQNWRRIQLNQLQVDIERAKLNRAESRILELERAVEHHVEQFRSIEAPPAHLTPPGRGRAHVEQIVEKYGLAPRGRIRVVDPDFPADAILTVGLITGYRGLCAYLRGNLKSAENQFETAVQILRNIGEQRACAIFLRHSSSLLSTMGMHEGASRQRRIGLAAADSVRQMDLSSLYRVEEVSARIVDRSEEIGANGGDMARGRNPRDLRQIMAAMNYSVLSDMFRVRIEARRTLAEMRFFAGDYDGALENAADALAVAARFGFSLRKISLRIMIGRILVARGDPDSGKALLAQAIANADRVGYQHAVELAQQDGTRDDRVNRA